MGIAYITIRELSMSLWYTFLMKFVQKIALIGVNPYVIPPKEILEKLYISAKKKSGPIPVKGTIDGKQFIQTLVKYQGAWRLYINGVMRKAAGVDVGDTAEIEIAFDAAPRIEPMHTKFQEALDKNTKARDAFAQLSPSRQKEINRYLNNMKSAVSLERNINRVIRHLVGDTNVGYFVLMDRSPK